MNSVKMSASDIDAHVGTQMRKRREVLGISQGRLGRHLGLTFSQIQKYEKGTNRIGAGRLYQIASFLGVTPSHFFIGIEGAEDVDARHEQDARLDGRLRGTARPDGSAGRGGPRRSVAGPSAGTFANPGLALGSPAPGSLSCAPGRERAGALTSRAGLTRDGARLTLGPGNR